MKNAEKAQRPTIWLTKQKVSSTGSLAVGGAAGRAGLQVASGSSAGPLPMVAATTLDRLHACHTNHSPCPRSPQPLSPVSPPRPVLHSPDLKTSGPAPTWAELAVVALHPLSGPQLTTALATSEHPSKDLRPSPTWAELAVIASCLPRLWPQKLQPPRIAHVAPRRLPSLWNSG